MQYWLEIIRDTALRRPAEGGQKKNAAAVTQPRFVVPKIFDYLFVATIIFFFF